MSADALTLRQAQDMLLDAVRDQGYRAFPLGQDAGAYLRAKRRRLTASSYRDYEASSTSSAGTSSRTSSTTSSRPSVLAAWRSSSTTSGAQRPPAPTTRRSPSSGTSSSGRSSDLHGDPTLPIERAKARGVHRETFSDDVRRALLADNAELRDRVALRLLLDYGLRKGSLRAVQFKHFDHNRRRLTIFGKGGTVRQLPLPHQPFWHDSSD